MGEALYYRHRVGCAGCNGDGTREPYPCPACEGTGWRWVYRRPTPTDLLTDPRVWAVVEALRHERARRLNLAERGVGAVPAALDEALAPFEEVPRE